MKKSLLLALAIFSIVGSSLFAQAIEGGGGVIYVDSDPNLIDDLITPSINEGHVVYDRDGQTVYFFNPAGTPYAGSPSATPGTEWTAVSLNAANTTVTGTGDITVTNPTPGTFNVDFSETHTTLTWNEATNTLTYQGEDGGPTVIDLTNSTDLDDGLSTIVNGSGTAADPYEIELDEFAGAANGTVPVKNATGDGLAWEKVVKSATFTATGELQLTFTDNTTVLVDMTNIPTVSDIGDLNTKAAAVAVTGGVAKAAVNNTFGMPATANGAVLFLIQN